MRDAVCHVISAPAEWCPEAHATQRASATKIVMIRLTVRTTNAMIFTAHPGYDGERTAGGRNGENRVSERTRRYISSKGGAKTCR
jgi:hypothetical protein